MIQTFISVILAKKRVKLAAQTFLTFSSVENLVAPFESEVSSCFTLHVSQNGISNNLCNVTTCTPVQITRISSK